MLHWLLVIVWEENLHGNCGVSLPALSYIVISFGIMLDHFSVVGDTVTIVHLICLWQRLDCSVNTCMRSPPVISDIVLITDSKLLVIMLVCHLIFICFVLLISFFHLTSQ